MLCYWLCFLYGALCFIVISSLIISQANLQTGTWLNQTCGRSFKTCWIIPNIYLYRWVILSLVLKHWGTILRLFAERNNTLLDDKGFLSLFSYPLLRISHEDKQIIFKLLNPHIAEFRTLILAPSLQYSAFCLFPTSFVTRKLQMVKMKLKNHSFTNANATNFK